MHACMHGWMDVVMYVCRIIYTRICLYIYIYVDRERERDMHICSWSLARVCPCVFLHFRAFRLGICEGFGFRGLRIFRDHLGLSEILLFQGLQFLTACLLRTLQFERGVGGRGGMGGAG